MPGPFDHCPAFNIQRLHPQSASSNHKKMHRQNESWVHRGCRSGQRCWREGWRFYYLLFIGIRIHYTLDSKNSPCMSPSHTKFGPDQQKGWADLKFGRNSDISAVFVPPRRQYTVFQKRETQLTTDFQKKISLSDSPVNLQQSIY